MLLSSILIIRILILFRISDFDIRILCHRPCLGGYYTVPMLIKKFIKYRGSHWFSGGSASTVFWVGSGSKPVSAK